MLDTMLSMNFLTARFASVGMIVRISARRSPIPHFGFGVSIPASTQSQATLRATDMNADSTVEGGAVNDPAESPGAQTAMGQTPPSAPRLVTSFYHFFKGSLGTVFVRQIHIFGGIALRHAGFRR